MLSAPKGAAKSRPLNALMFEMTLIAAAANARETAPRTGSTPLEVRRPAL